MQSSLLDKNTKIKVSSVLNKDTKSYGKQFLCDSNEETCWNSDQGDSQWICINFDKNVRVSKCEIKFQGGFSSSHCVLEASSTGSADYQTISEFYPGDDNSNQVFTFEQSSDSFCNYRLRFESNTDLFGRLIIYNLQFYGIFC